MNSCHAEAGISERNQELWPRRPCATVAPLWIIPLLSDTGTPAPHGTKLSPAIGASCVSVILECPFRASSTDGASLVKLLQTGTAPARDTFYWHNPAPRPARTGESKYLAAERPEDRDRSLAKLNAWRKEVGASMQANEKKKKK